MPARVDQSPIGQGLLNGMAPKAGRIGAFHASIVKRGTGSCNKKNKLLQVDIK
jgi:hypothetical protein